MDIRNTLNRIRIWISRVIQGGKSRPKLPRKKIQIQFEEVRKQFETHTTLLQKKLDQVELLPSTRLVGEDLLNKVQRFQNYNLPQINKERLNQIVNPLLHPIDISMWTLYQMHSFTEEIFHFIKTMETVQL